MPSESFLWVPSLRVLGLERNPLVQLGSRAFSPLAQLETLRS